MYNWVSKVIWALSCFSFLYCVLVPENLYHPLNQLDSKPKALSVSIVLDFTLHSDWLFVIFSFLLIGCFNHFGFCFVTVKGKALCCTTCEIYTSIFFILLLPPTLPPLVDVCFSTKWWWQRWPKSPSPLPTCLQFSKAMLQQCLVTHWKIHHLTFGELGNYPQHKP